MLERLAQIEKSYEELTAQISSPEFMKDMSLYAKPSLKADVVAQLQPGVLGTLKTCDGSWCRMTGTGFDGWMPQDKVWGAYPNEKVD